MSTRRKQRGKTTSMSGTSNVQNMHENTWLPPGPTSADDQHAETQAVAEETSNEAYPPAVTIQDEATHKAEEEVKTEERVKRAKQVSAPKRISTDEIRDIALLLKLLPEGDNIPLDTPIPMESLPEELRQSFFAPGQKKNLYHRGFVKLLQNPETKQWDALTITEPGYSLYMSKLRKPDSAPQQRKTKANGEPAARGPRASKSYPDNLRLRKMIQDNPRQKDTMGYFAWQLYQDGMNYNEYLDRKKDFPPATNRGGTPFDGPRLDHWSWDLRRGYIALYREGEPETLEDGSPNSRYWAIKNVADELPETTTE